MMSHAWGGQLKTLGGSSFQPSVSSLGGTFGRAGEGLLMMSHAWGGHLTPCAPLGLNPARYNNYTPPPLPPLSSNP